MISFQILTYLNFIEKFRYSNKIKKNFEGRIDKKSFDPIIISDKYQFYIKVNEYGFYVYCFNDINNKFLDLFGKFIYNQLKNKEFIICGNSRDLIEEKIKEV